MPLSFFSFGWFRRQKAAVAQERTRGQNSSLSVEALEDRTVLSGGVSVALQGSFSTLGSLNAAAIPGDNRFNDQWAMQNTGQQSGTVGADIRATQAWDVTTGSSKLSVAVMDTGIDYTHQDLYLNIYLNQGEIPASRRANLIDTNGDGLITFRDLNDSRNQGIRKISDSNGNGYIDGADLLTPMIKDATGRDTGRGGWADGASQDGDSYVDDLIGWNFVRNNNNPMDDFGHGTHVAGTIGAIGNNTHGVVGVAYNVQLMPIKFLDNTGNGGIDKYITALKYAVSKGAKISNNSWTGASYSSDLVSAINEARAAGHIFVAAAGNQGNDNDDQPTYPASFRIDNIVSVAATDRNDKLTSFSNFGANSVTLAAPGIDILSTTPGNNYGYNSGTSMATPHVSGVLALVWSQNPGWTYREVINRVSSTVDRLPALSGKTTTGGRINAASAVGVVQAQSTPPRITSAVPGGPDASSLTSVRVTFDRSISSWSFNANDISLVGPNGAGIAISRVSVVAGSTDRTFDIVFNKQTAEGNYNLRIGPDVLSSTGSRMTQYSTTFRLSAPPRITSAVFSGSNGSSLNSVRVTFDRAISGWSFNAQDVNLTGPNGSNIGISGVNVVTGSGDRTFDIAFANQTAEGNYNLQIGPDVLSSSGTRMVAYSTTYRLTLPPQVTGAVFSGPNSSSLNSVRVTFNTAIALWSFTPSDIVLTGPNGNKIDISSVRVVSGSGDRVFDLAFSTQTAGGNYNLQIGPSVVNLSEVYMTPYSTSYRLNAVVAADPRIISSSASGPNANSLSTIRVTFDQAIQAWSFTPYDVNLTGPNGGRIAVTSVKVVGGSGDRTFDISFATQTAAGNYNLRIGPEVLNAGNKWMATYTTSFRVNAATPTVSSARTYTSNSPVSVRANDRGVSSLNIADNVKIGDVNVKLNISHPKVGDLYVLLQAPDGTSIVLLTGNGGSTANINLTLDDSASKSISQAVGALTGTYKPTSALANLVDKSAMGTWKLWVMNRGTSQATINNWSLTITSKA